MKMLKAYRITREGKEVWQGYQCANLPSALATAFFWHQNTYSPTTNKYIPHEIYECEYQTVPWGTPGEKIKPVKECNPVLVGVFSEDGPLKILKQFAKEIKFSGAYNIEII